MKWFDIVKELEFKGGIVYNMPDPPTIDWQGGLNSTKLTKFHLTLFSPKEMKPFKNVHNLSNKQAKDKIRIMLESYKRMKPNYPSLSYGLVSVARRGSYTHVEGKTISESETSFYPLTNQGEWQAYSDDLANHLGIPPVKRFFHVSIANNQGGDPYKSIGDINEGDVER